MKKILALTCCCVDVFPEKNIVNAGGNALNVAVSCSKTKKADVYLMGNIGIDFYGKKIKETADRFKINRQKLYEVEGETANNKIYITDEGDRYFKEDSWTNGVLRDFKISESDLKFMKDFDAIATTYNDQIIVDIADIKSKTTVLFSVDFLDHNPTEEWCYYFQYVDIFFISGKNEHLHLYKKWSTEYQTLFVATLGVNGSIAYKNGDEYICKAVEVEKVIDTTGCGDSYQGAFIVDYLIKKNVISAMKAGSEAAAITLSFVGAI